jgi:hypothetical protein
MEPFEFQLGAASAPLQRSCRIAAILANAPMGAPFVMRSTMRWGCPGVHWVCIGRQKEVGHFGQDRVMLAGKDSASEQSQLRWRENPCAPTDCLNVVAEVGPHTPRLR